jgi:hypothetical protein
MIYIEQGELNNIVLTLTESTTISNPVYLFKFTWELTDSISPIYWVGTDLSAYPQRYNLFELEEGTDATFRIGQYKYEVYESANPIVVDDETTEGVLDKIEEGRMVVNGTATTIYE